MPTRQSAEDALEVRALAGAYTDACNRMCGEDMAAVYAPDGELVVGGRSFKGLPLITKVFKRLVEVDREFLFQMNHNGVVDLNGDQAQARWWFSEVKRHTGEAFYRYSMGCYQDEAVRLDTGWRYARRTVQIRFEINLPLEETSHHPFVIPFLQITGLPRL